MVEQLIPMLGLEHLLHAVKPLPPHTTPDKILFLIEHAFTEGGSLTTIISFTSLITLIVTRALKRRIGKFGIPYTAWVPYIPEVFILVVVSTSEYI